MLNKKFGSIFSLMLPSFIIASDQISIDTLFKQQNGIRSITSLGFMSSGSSKSFSTYPQISSYDEGVPIIQTKKLTLNQTLIYSYNKNIDLIANLSAENSNIDFIKDTISSKSETEFLSSWFGLKYTFDKNIGDFKQSLTTQVALYEKNNYLNKDKTSSFKSFNVKYNLLAYLDPVVVNMYISTVQNRAKKVGDIKVEYPDIYSFGLDTSIVLNPTISLSLNFEQSYQEHLKEDSKKVNPSSVISIMGFGLTYSINSNNALIISTSTGASSSSPDSRLSFALWHKF